MPLSLQCTGEVLPSTAEGLAWPLLPLPALAVPLGSLDKFPLNCLSELQP